MHGHGHVPQQFFSLFIYHSFRGERCPIYIIRSMKP